jgi:predicted PurR-regulated permease PerM
MDKRKIFHYVLVGILLVLLYACFILVKPFLTYLIFGLILTYIFHPLYKRLNQKIRKEWLSSTLMIILILLIIIIPSAFIITGLVDQSISAYNSLAGLEVSGITEDLATRFGIRCTRNI